MKYAIRIVANESLERDIRDIAELLTRRGGRRSHKPVVWCKSFLCRSTAVESKCVGRNDPSLTFEYLVVQRRQIDQESASPRGSSNVEVVAVTPESTVDVPVNMRQYRTAFKQRGQRWAAQVLAKRRLIQSAISWRMSHQHSLLVEKRHQ